MITKYIDYLKEGRGISNVVKDYSRIIFDKIVESDNDFMLSLFDKSLPLENLKININNGKIFYGIFDPSKSEIINNKLYGVIINLVVDPDDVDFEVNTLGLLSHELTHCLEYYEFHTKSKNIILITPKYITIKSAYNGVTKQNNYFDYFLNLIYLSLDTEMNARVSQVYHYLLSFKTIDEDILMDKLKNHKNYGNYNKLSIFNYENWLKLTIDQIGLDKLLFLTNQLINEFTNKSVNTETKKLSFIGRKMEDEKDLHWFYGKWSVYFKQKSIKHEQKLNRIINEVISDLKSNKHLKEKFTEFELDEKFDREEFREEF